MVKTRFASALLITTALLAAPAGASADGGYSIPVAPASSSRGPARPTVAVTGLTAALMSASAPSGAPPPALPLVRNYGELFEALLRGWSLLPLGLYRRVAPHTADEPVAPQPATVTDPVSVFVASFDAASAVRSPFRADVHLLSYVLTNPPPDSAIGADDLVYVLKSEEVGGGEE